MITGETGALGARLSFFDLRSPRFSFDPIPRPPANAGHTNVKQIESAQIQLDLSQS